MENGLVHHVGDVETLSQQFTMLHENHDLLQKMRSNTLRVASNYTWNAVGKVLLNAYREALDRKKRANSSLVSVPK
jgi:glycosyltransferase involved in cell wall biosynthesis